MKNCIAYCKVWVSALAMLVLGILLLPSCSEKEDEEKFENLKNFEKVYTIRQASIQILMASLSAKYPEANSIIEKMRYDVDVYRITYETVYRDSVINASGLVCIPVAKGQFPLISFQNGTLTKDDNAPSVNPYNTDYVMLESMAGNGYIMLMPDYIGFGASAKLIHPYHQRTTTNDAVLDMLPACEDLLNTEEVQAGTNGHIYLMGYSQGGWATLSVLDEAENGNGNLQINGASCGAGAYDLLNVSEYFLDQETISSVHYLPYFIFSQIAYGAITDGLQKFFNEPYASRIPQLFDGSKSSGEITAQLNDTIARLIKPDMILNFSTSPAYDQVRQVMSDNSIQPWNTSTPLSFYHGTADETVPPFLSQDIYDGFIQAGTSSSTVSLIEMEGMTHGTGIIPWGISTINWFNQLEGN